MAFAARMTSICVAVACCVGASSCSSDDSPVADVPDSSAALVPDSSAALVADSSVPTRDPGGDATSGTPGTLDTPASENPDIDILAAALLAPDAVGVPDTWAIRDLDPGVPVQQLASDDVDLAFGVVDCPFGPPATGTDGLWVRRRLAAPEQPLDNGLLAVEVVAEVQDDDGFARRLGGIENCLGQDDAAVVDVELQRRPASETDGPAGAVVTVGAAPSERVAFPSRHAIAVAHDGRRTVTVAFSGIDQGNDWSADAVELADRVLGLLDA